MDTQDVARWWTGETITPTDAGQSRPVLGFHDPAYADAGGDNVPNPYLGVIDPDGFGPAPNQCIQAPDRASLGQDSQALLAAVGGQHAACDG